MHIIYILLFFRTGAALCLFSLYVWWTNGYWSYHGIKGPRGLPLFGSMLKFCLGRQHYGEVYQNIYNTYPELPFVGFYRIFNEPVILLRDLDLIKEVMIRSFNNFEDNVLWVDPQRDPIATCNPFVAKSENWKLMRSEIVPIFTPTKVKASYPHIAAICSKLDEYVQQHLNSHFEAKELFSKFTLDVVASAGYGLDAQSFTNQKSDFVELAKNLFLPNSWSLIETTALLFSPKLGDLINYRYVPPPTQKWLKTVIGAVLDKKKDLTTCSHSDFIQWLLEARQKSGNSVDRDIIVGHCGTFLLEGFETSSSLMAFALYELAKNPSIQKRILEEIDAVLEKYGNVISFDAIQEMNYLEAALYETLRLHPAMKALLKHCTKPFCLPAQIPGGKQYVVKKGMVIVIPVYAIHCDANLYPDPKVFNPERFIDSQDKLCCAFLGFGEGPRMCPGMRFGLAQSKAGLITLLAKYSVHLADKKNFLELSTTTFLTAAKNGIWIDFKNRK